MKSMTITDVAAARASLTGTKPRRSTRRPSIGETFAFRDLLLEQISTRYPRMAADLSSRLAGEWGSFTERAFYRAIAWLLSRGKIERIGTRQDGFSGGYVRTARGGTETAEDIELRRRIMLTDEGRCYRCERSITKAQHRRRKCCGPCQSELWRERVARRSTGIVHRDLKPDNALVVDDGDLEVTRE